MTPPAAGPSLTSDPLATSLNSSETSLVTVSSPHPAPPAPVLVSAPATVPRLAPEPAFAPKSPTPAPVAENNSEDSSDTRNDISPAQTGVVSSDDPPARVFEPLAIAVYSEPTAEPSTSALESTGNSDDQGGSGTSKKTKRPTAKKKAPKAKAPKAKKLTAK